MAEGRLSSTQEAFEKYFKDVKRVRIAIEAGAHSRRVSELLSNYGHEVLVANPRNLQLISESVRKSDRVDARALARLARVDPTLLSPLTHRKSESYPHMAQLRARHVLVPSRTSIVNAIRGMAKAVGLRLPACSTETFAGKVSSLLPDDLKASLLLLLETTVTLNLQIQKSDRAIYHLAKYRYPETERLRQVSGVA
jgi:transposase